MFAAVYCENLKQWVFELDGPARKQCNFSLDVSKFKGHPVHSYIGFIRKPAIRLLIVIMQEW